MARYFLRLKLSLLRNALRSSGARKVGLVLGVVAWVGLVTTALGLLAASRSQRVVTALVFDAFFLGWLIVPLIGMGTDETLDPSRLALLPLDPPALIRGLLTASMVGVGPVATLVAVSGVLARHRPGVAGTIIVAAAVVVEVLLCLVGSRAMTTGFSSVLRSRRGRDLVAFALAAAALIPALAGQAIPRVLPSGGGGIRVGPIGRVVFWLPSGWLADAVLHARTGGLVRPGLEVAGAVGVLWIALWIWSRSLQRVLTTSEPARTHTAAKRHGLFSAPLGFLPRTRTGAVAAKELRYLWRDPRRRASMLSVAILLSFPVLGVVTGQTRARELVLLAGAGGLVVCLQAVNQFGYDGPAFWLHVAAGGDPAADLWGKNLGLASVGVVVIGAEALLLAALSGGWAYVPGTILLGAGVMGIALGVANETSVLAPYPAADTTANLWANNAGCLTALTGLLAIAVIGGLLVPVGVGVAITIASWHGGFLLVAAAGCAYGIGVWEAGTRLAARRLRSHQIECLEAVSGRSSR